ncbi:DUF2987 domain-containing protein [Thalassotalea maritima]|uniref:DUF2987 domain-containing protein n=1 Tax=Thalassotalea maritima TaxID=3242416 RepID=UPI003527B069
MKKLLLLSLGLFASSVQAVDLEYKGFYQRLTLIEENNLDKITIGFYLVDSYTRERCPLTGAKMLKRDGSKDPIDIAADGQLMVPLSQQYYDEFALLRVEQSDDRQNCILQMQMQARDKQQTEFSYQQLATITWQLQELVDEFGGFLSFMMPDVQGLHIQLQNQQDVAYIASDLKQQLSCEQDKCQLLMKQNDEREQTAIRFAKPPVVISPWIED